MKTRTSGGVGETVKTLVYAIVIALFIRTFFYEPFSIPSGSMVPTLLIGDYLFVSKFSYGYSRYSLPWGLPLIPGRIFFHSPQRGDVAVFKLPSDPSVDYIKRIIGLPGDRVQTKGGVLYINDAPVKLEPTDRCDPRDNAPAAGFRSYWETLPNGVKHCIIKIRDNAPLDNAGPFTVKEGTYFMMGDNRDNSADSRDPNSGVGFVPAENLVGHAVFVFFSTDGSARLWEVWKWFFSIRYDRLFTAIH